ARAAAWRPAGRHQRGAMHNWDWAIHNRGAPRPQVARSRTVLAAAVRGRRRAAAAAPPRQGKPGLHIAGRVQRAPWPAALRQPAEAGGLADRRVGSHRRRRPTADNPAEEDRPEADRPEEAGSTAPTPRCPTLRGRSVAPRWHQLCGKPFPPPLTQPWIDRWDQPRTRQIQDHRGKRMTNLLINLVSWNPPRFNNLAGSDGRGAAGHVFLPSLNTALATRKQSTPTGTPQ